jgi:hypothetical protein
VPYEKIRFTPWDKISESARGNFGPIYEAAYQHYVHRKGLEMHFTKQVIEADKVTLVARRGPGPYRPETSTPNAGICWGTLMMYNGDEDPQAVKH